MKKLFLAWHPLSSSLTAPFHPPCPSTLQCTSLMSEQYGNVCRYNTGLLQLSEPKVLIINWDLKIITRRQQSRQLCSIMTKYAEQRGRGEHTLCLLVSVQLRGMLISMFIWMAFIVTIIFLLRWIFFFIFLRVITSIKALLHGTVKEKAYPEWACLLQNHYWMLQDLSMDCEITYSPHRQCAHTHTFFS